MLHVGISILVHPVVCFKYDEWARVLFVKDYSSVYGTDQIVYNVHSLNHLAADAKKFGSLDGISAFPFENYMKYLKRRVRKPDLPLQQVINRVHEHSMHTIIPTSANPEMCLKQEHSSGTLTQRLISFSQCRKCI